MNRGAGGQAGVAGGGKMGREVGSFSQARLVVLDRFLLGMRRATGRRGRRLSRECISREYFRN